MDTSASGKLLFIVAAIHVVIPASQGRETAQRVLYSLTYSYKHSPSCLCIRFTAEMVSQCVKNDTIVQLSCPVVGFDENYDFIDWFSETDELDYDYDNAEFSARRSINKERGYETEEITCCYGEEAYNEQIYNAIIVITGKTKTLSTANVYHFFHLPRCS